MHPLSLTAHSPMSFFLYPLRRRVNAHFIRSDFKWDSAFSIDGRERRSILCMLGKIQLVQTTMPISLLRRSRKENAGNERKLLVPFLLPPRPLLLLLRLRHCRQSASFFFFSPSSTFFPSTPAENERKRCIYIYIYISEEREGIGRSCACALMARQEFVSFILASPLCYSRRRRRRRGDVC